MPRLVVESGLDKGLVYALPVGRITIGRSSGNAIQLIDKRASRRHVELRVHNTRVVVRDLESRNGTYLNDDKLEGESLLNDGDRVRVGDTTLVFERDSAEQSAMDATSKVVRLVADLPYGREKGVASAGLAETDPPRPGTELKRDVKDPNQRLQLLYQVSEAIRTVHDTHPLLEAVMDALFAFFDPDRAFIMLKDEKSASLTPYLVRFRRGSEENEIAISSTIVDRCLKDRISILVSDALSDTRFRASESIKIQKIRSAICAPLIYQDETLGVIYLDNRSRSAAYDQPELELATGMANQTAVGLHLIRLRDRVAQQRVTEREMEIAREIQTRLLPHVPPQAPNYEFAAMSLPARKVGGDYYDFLELPENRLGLAIADVSGKGVPAAILLASLRSALQAEGLRDASTITELVEHLNRMVWRDTDSAMYVTMVYGVLHPVSGVFEYVNAGHPYPLLFSSDGALVELDSGGSFLGIAENGDYVKGHTQIRPGATLVLYSDGVTDTLSESGDLFGRERLIELIRKNLGRPAADLRETIYREAFEFKGEAEQFDDFTLLIVRSTQAADSKKEREED